LTNIALHDFLFTWLYDWQPTNSFKINKTIAQIVIDEIKFSEIIVKFNGLFPHAVMGDFATQSDEISENCPRRI